MKKQKSIETDKKEFKSPEITFRVIQAICTGLFALGISMGIGEYAEFIKLPFSIFSITSLVFGLLGIIYSEIMARVAAKW